MIRRSSRVITGLAALALGASLLGCGEKSEPPTTGKVVAQTTTASTTTTTTDQQQKADQQAAQTAASAFLISPDAAAICDEGIAPALLRKAYGDRKGCLAARKPNALAKDVQISSTKLGASGTATIVANAKGGTYGKGEKVTMSVVRDGTGAWRVDTVKSNAPVGP